MQYRSKISMTFTGIMIMILFITSCVPIAPTPVITPQPSNTPLPPTATPLPTPTPTPSSIDLVGKVLTALDRVNHSPLDCTMTYVTHLQQQVEQNGKVLFDQPLEETFTDRILRAQNGSGWDTQISRVYLSPSESSIQLQGEIRQVDGIIFASGKNLASQEPSEFPASWTKISGEASMHFWPGLRKLQFAETISRLNGASLTLLTGQPLEQTRASLEQYLSGAAYDYTKLDNGTPVELITIELQAVPLSKTIHNFSAGDKLTQAVLQSGAEAQVIHEFALDFSGQLVAWNISLGIDARNLDLSQTTGFQPGTRLSVRGSQQFSTAFNYTSQPVVEQPAKNAVQVAPAFFSTQLDPTPLFTNLADFDTSLNNALATGEMNTFWQQIKSLRQMPLIFGDMAVFLYRGEAESVSWVGDWHEMAATNGWRLGSTDLWISTVRLPLDARLEYQIQVNGSEAFITDPLNPITEVSRQGTKSAFTMPKYQTTEFTQTRENVARGELSETLTIRSGQLGYEVNYRVYTPAGYSRLRRLPSLYVTDGQDYIQYGKMATILDNLIAEQKIRPIIVVFIDTRDPETGENRREEQFIDNPKYGQFIVNDLVPWIDTKYYTDRTADSRAILGVAEGGYYAAAFALDHTNRFHLIGMQSPALDIHEGSLLDQYRQLIRLPVSVFLTTGTMNDHTQYTREMKAILEEKQIPLNYIESSEGPSFGNWRDKLDDMLIYFFQP